MELDRTVSESEVQLRASNLLLWLSLPAQRRKQTFLPESKHRRLSKFTEIDGLQFYITRRLQKMDQKSQRQLSISIKRR
jgi:hypothetical protein